jgi:hypothetical protein
MITAYYLCHGLWTVIPHQLEENFRDMADCGFTAVAISFSESEMSYARRAFEIQVNLAHKCGLKALVIPSRIGGRLAGAPLMPSIWLSKNPQYRVPLDLWMPVACLESPAFIDWSRDFVGTIVHDYDIDGIIWDEPKDPAAISTHPDTIARFGPDPTAEQMMDSYVDWLEALTRHARSIKPDLSITLFCQRPDPEYFTQQAARRLASNYHGYDGNLARQSSFHEEPRWRKYRVESVWDRTMAECSAGGKKSFALVENMLMPAVAIPEYERNLDAYLQQYRPDHLSLYYYAHNNEDPEAVHAITRRLMQKHVKGR